MANVAAPFGFKAWGTASGPPNFAENHNPPYRIAGGASGEYATPIYFGDAVRMNSVRYWLHRAVGKRRWFNCHTNSRRHLCWMLLLLGKPS